ncbi:voltage-dependent L-type calcium channel subunit [Wolffia australiana]
MNPVLDPMTGDPSVDQGNETLVHLLRNFSEGIFSPRGLDLNHLRYSLSEIIPRLEKAFRNSAREILLSARHGSPLRRLVAILFGTIAAVLATGSAVFLMFFIVATLNAIIISLLVSLAVAGGFLALFFSCLVAMYIGALLVAGFVISIVSIATIIGALFTAGWVGLIGTIFVTAKKGLEIARQYVSLGAEAQNPEAKED